MAGVAEERVEHAGVSSRALRLEGDPGSAEPGLVLLHGFSDSADTWRPLMAELAESGRAAVALDMPGFGQADRLARDRPILPQLDRFAIAAVREEAERSPTGSVVVAGNSLGGCEAMRIAQRDDVPIAGVVPIAPAGLDLAAWIGIIEGAWAIQAILRSPVPLPTPVVRGLVGQAYRRLASSRPEAVSGSVVEAFTRSFSSKRDVVRLLGTGRSLRPEIRDPFQLEWIRCPVLVIWGENDRMVSVAGAERIAEKLPDARIERIPDCGHCPQIEYPERVAELLAELPLAVGR